jgi:predicted DNA-binding transcriptional regulator YafY
MPTIMERLPTMLWNTRPRSRGTAAHDRWNAQHLTLRHACEARETLRLGYRDAQGQESVRVVWPLGLVAWVGRWRLLAWCETREGYRNFRLDRVTAIERTGERLPARADRSLADYLSRIEGAAD